MKITREYLTIDQEKFKKAMEENGYKSLLQVGSTFENTSIATFNRAYYGGELSLKRAAAIGKKMGDVFKTVKEETDC